MSVEVAENKALVYRLNSSNKFAELRGPEGSAAESRAPELLS